MAESQQQEIARLEELFAANPEGRIFTHLAEAYRRAGEIARAREILEQGISKHPECSSAYVVLGRVLVDNAEPAAAEEAFGRVIELDPHNLVALRALGDLHRAAGRVQEAREYYEQLLALDPSSAETEEALAQLAEAATGPDAGTEAEAGETVPSQESQADEAAAVDMGMEAAGDADMSVFAPEGEHGESGAAELEPEQLEGLDTTWGDLGAGDAPDPGMDTDPGLDLDPPPEGQVREGGLPEYSDVDSTGTDQALSGFEVSEPAGLDDSGSLLPDVEPAGVEGQDPETTEAEGQDFEPAGVEGQDPDESVSEDAAVEGMVPSDTAPSGEELMDLLSREVASSEEDAVLEGLPGTEPPDSTGSVDDGDAALEVGDFDLAGDFSPRDSADPEGEEVDLSWAEGLAESAEPEKLEFVDEPAAPGETGDADTGDLLAGETGATEADVERGAPGDDMVFTETMGDIYASQGLLDRAAEVYRELLLGDKQGDKRLEAKLTDVMRLAADPEGGIPDWAMDEVKFGAPSAPEAGTEEVEEGEAPPLPGGADLSAFAESLEPPPPMVEEQESWDPGMESIAEPEAVEPEVAGQEAAEPEAGEPEAVEPEAGGAFFQFEESAAPEAADTDAGEEESARDHLRRLLGWSPEAVTTEPEIFPEVGGGRAGSPGSGSEPPMDEFDELFGGASPEEAGGTSPAASDSDDDDDLEMFRTWLQGLKR